MKKERECYFLSTLQGRNAIKTYEYAVYTTIDSFNQFGLCLIDMTQRKIYSISNSTFVVEDGTRSYSLIFIAEIKISQLLRCLLKLQQRAD